MAIARRTLRAATTAMLLVISALAGSLLWADNAQRIVPISSDLYDCLDTICLESGMGAPSSARPYSVDEFIAVLERVDASALSEAGNGSLRYLRDELVTRSFYGEPDGLEIGGELRASAEAYVHTDADFLEWEHGYEDRRPLVDIPLELWAGRSFYALMEPVLAKDPCTVTQDADNRTNIITDISDMDGHFPFRSFLSVGGPHWNVALGRDTLSWGAGRTGNLMLSDELDWHDHLRFTTYWKAFKFTACYLSLENWETTTAASEDIRAFIGHRIEMRFLDRITLALLEGMMIETPGFELRYLNPFMVFHSYLENDGRTNVNLGIELEANPWRWITLYAQACGDQIQSAYEKSRYPGTDALPDAWGWLAGARARLPAGPGYLGIGMEWAHADPWLYLASGQPDYLVDRRVLSNHLGSMMLRTKALGYWTGPDAVVWAGSLGYTVYGSFDVGLELLYLLKGEIGLDSAWQSGEEAVSLSAPSGDSPERRLALSLSGSWSPWPFVTVASELTWVHVTNHEHVADAGIDDLQWTPSVSFRLRPRRDRTP